MRKWLWIGIVVCVGIWWMWPPRTVEIKNVKNAGYTLVAFGDSLTYGYGAARDDSYPAVLARSLNRPVINLGKNGETAQGAAPRIAQALAENPYMVLLEFGGNDFMKGVSFEQTLHSMEQMVDAVQAAGAVAVIVDTGGYYGMQKYSKAYKKIAREKGAVFVPGILDGIFNKSAYKADQIHPNAAGYAVVAERVEKAIKPYL